MIGSKHRAVISKELKMRQVLSRTCLYSSWFEVEEVRVLAPNSRSVLSLSPPPAPLPASGAGEFVTISPCLEELVETDEETCGGTIAHGKLL